MNSIDNIPLKDYFDLEDKSEYNFVINYSKRFKTPFDVFAVGDLTEQTFGLVKDLQYDFQRGLTFEKYSTYLTQVTGKDLTELVKIGILEHSQFRAYLLSEIDRINKIESEALSSEIEDDEIEAGIERFNVFGSLSQFRSIAITYHTTVDTVKTWKYSFCFSELYYQKISSEFQRDLLRIRSKRRE